MDESSLLAKMCEEFLGAVDIKAICRNRGFPAQVAASRTVLESSFLSSAGITAALADLTRDESLPLHVMHHRGDAVDLSFFEPIYGDEKQRNASWQTFTRRYRKVHRKVMDSLVRKGVLIVAEDPTRGAVAKLERLRYRFPAAFGAFLPSPFHEVAVLDAPGEPARDTARNELLAALSAGRLEAPAKGSKRPMSLADGQLMVGDQPFTRRSLKKWQADAWERALWAGQRGGKPDFSLAGAVVYLLSRLREREWVAPPALKPAMDLFFSGLQVPEPDRVCKEGWKQDCLARCRHGRQTYYRLPGDDEPSERELTVGLKAAGKQWVGIDASKVHLTALEVLARTANLRVSQGNLHALPDIKKLGRLWEELCDHPLAMWLKENSPAYRAAVDAVAKRRGECIVHKNLLIARIRDLSLRVKIEKAITDRGKLRVLHDELIVFSPAVRRDVERLVKKAGHVVKVVEPA